VNLVVEVATIARDEIERAVEMRLRGRALCPALNGSARSTRAGDNKSLNRSGFSGSLLARFGRLPRCFAPGQFNRSAASAEERAHIWSQSP